MNMSKTLEKYSDALIESGKAFEKHPVLSSMGSGAFSFGTSGAIVGGIIGGIRDDETFLEGAGKGALIGTGIGAVGGIGATKVVSSIYMDSDKISDLGKLMQGMGHDGLGFTAKMNGKTGKYII